jgi:hypothetical protein
MMNYNWDAENISVTNAVSVEPQIQINCLKGSNLYFYGSRLVFKSTFDRVIAAFGLHHQQHKQLSEKL